VISENPELDATLTSTLPVDSLDTEGLPRSRGEYCDGTLPLAQYSQLLVLFNLAFAVFLGIARQTGRRLPERVSWSDILLVGIATFKLSRTLSKETVTAPLRAPFTRFEGKAGEGEVNESPRGEGWQRSVGELLTCPFCLGMWVAALFAYGLVLAPPLTRFVASILATKVISDGMHLAYTAACKGVD
jgi:hypothetical protein